MSELPNSEQTQLEGILARMAADPNAFAQEYLSLKKEKEELGQDKLTGLLTRNSFEIQAPNFIATALRHNEILLALFFDLDKLKTTNDTSGHEAGDDLLKKVAHELETTFRKTDIVSRYGGDEFVVLTTVPTDNGKVEGATEAIINRLFDTTSHDEYSLGISTVKSEGDLAEALKNADRRMYIDKGRGKLRHDQ